MANICSHIDHDNPKLKGQVPETMITGSIGDISELAEFQWYEWIYFRDTTESFLLPEETLGRYIGPSYNVDSKMSMWILKDNRQVVSRTTLRSLTEAKIASDVKKSKRKVVDDFIRIKLGKSITGKATINGDFLF